MGNQGAPPKEINSARVRERLLAKSLELFTAKGYAATSVREIVVAAGVTKPVLYYYFGSKEALYLEIMNGTYATFEELVTRLTACRGTTRQRVLHFCSGVFDMFVEHLAVARLIYAVYFGPPQGAPYFPHDDYFDRMLKVLGEMVHDGIISGEIAPVDETDATWALMACLSTVMEEQLCHGPPRIDRSRLERMLNLIIDGISQRR